MTDVHRLVVYVVDEGRYTERDIATKIRLIPDLNPTIVRHAIRPLMSPDELPSKRRLTHEELEAWFHENRPDRPTTQTVISVIQSTPSDIPGQIWLKQCIVPLLKDERFSAVKARLAAQPDQAFGEDTRPLLVRIVCELVNQIVEDQGAQEPEF